MELYSVFSLLVAALFAYLNHRFLRLPSTTGLMTLTLLSSLGLERLGGWACRQCYWPVSCCRSAFR